MHATDGGLDRVQGVNGPTDERAGHEETRGQWKQQEQDPDQARVGFALQSQETDSQHVGSLDQFVARTGHEQHQEEDDRRTPRDHVRVFRHESSPFCSLFFRRTAAFEFWFFVLQLVLVSCLELVLLARGQSGVMFARVPKAVQTKVQEPDERAC